MTLSAQQAIRDERVGLGNAPGLGRSQKQRWEQPTSAATHADGGHRTGGLGRLAGSRCGRGDAASARRRSATRPAQLGRGRRPRGTPYGRSMETVDDGGEWWLPEAPDRKVSGWLTFTVDDGAQLRLWVRSATCRRELSENSWPDREQGVHA
jgi:hypothetical protein